MDTEKSEEVLDVSESPQQHEAVMEKEVVSKLETQEESNVEPEKSPAADEEEKTQLAVNGHDDVEVTEETVELIVTENVSLCVEKTEIVIEESSPAEKDSEMESVPDVVAPPSPPHPDPVESSENIPDPVAALEAEPQNAEPEQQRVPESDPEPAPEQTPLAGSAAEPEPEKPTETVPEAQTQQEQTSPEPAAPLLQSPDTQPPGEEKEVEAEVPAAMNTVAEELAAKEEAAENIVAAVEEKPVASVVVTEVSPEKPKESEAVKEEAPAEAGGGEPAEEKKKEAEPEKPAEALKEPEVAAAAAEGEEPEKNEAEHPKEVEEDPAPEPGSLSFALLEREQTKDALKTSRTLIVLRGLPGSGKSFLARAIAEAYKPNCSVLSADDHAVKPENAGASADAYKALDEAVVASCSAGTASPLVVVVDDTNHTQHRLGRLGEIAEQHHLVAIFLEPRTEWSRDPAQLCKKSRRGLEEAQLEAMRGTLEEVNLPLYFGWFLLSSVQEKVRCTSMDFLKTLDTLEAFKKHLIDFTGKAEKEVDLEQYFQAKGTLHCTTKFCDYGKAEGANEYAQTQAVKDFYGSAFELSLSALFVTPRTVGARVSLTEEQLLLWPADAEKGAESSVPAAASLPLGSRAHVTIGCAEGVEPVQTGLDLLEIEALLKDGQQGEPVEEMELGSLSYFGEGRWLLTLREPICAPACFSSFYGSKEQEPTKKEPEKKKQKKCTIL